MEDLTQGVESINIPGPSAANTFKYVKTNVPGPGCDLDLFMEEFQGCACVKVEGRCGDSCPCLNLFGPAYDNDGLLLEKAFCSQAPSRSIIECGRNCDCSIKAKACCTRLAQNGIQRKLRVVWKGNKGFGLESEDEVVRLAFVCEYAGQVISEEEAKKRLAESKSTGQMNYIIAVKESSIFSQSKVFVDPRLEGNIGRFINHSCDPNLLMVPTRVNHSVPRLALFARRRISSGEELTFDYSGCTPLDLDATFSYSNSLDKMRLPSCLSEHLLDSKSTSVSNSLDEKQSSLDSDSSPSKCLGEKRPDLEQSEEILTGTPHLFVDSQLNSHTDVTVNEISSSVPSLSIDRSSYSSESEATEHFSCVKRRRVTHLQDTSSSTQGSSPCTSKDEVFDSVDVESKSLSAQSLNEKLNLNDDGYSSNIRPLVKETVNVPKDDVYDRVDVESKSLSTKSLNEKLNSYDDGYSSIIKPLVKETVAVPCDRRKCLCNSECCKGFLPYDSLLFS